MEIVNNKEAILLRELRNNTARWVKGEGPLNHIVISTRIRLARNLKNIPFPFKASDRQREQVLMKIESLLKDSKLFYNFKLININNLEERDIQFLVEKRLISLALAHLNYSSRALIYGPDEVMSMLVNEEDHFRLQSLLPGYQLKKVWEIINCYDREMMNKIDYAFNEKEGFLTCCPTNLGTGLRASVMLHLPALIIMNKLSDLIAPITKKDFAIRGFYGEGSSFQGNLFQVSNQTTLGFTEGEILENLEIETKKLIEEEEKTREELILNHRTLMEDQIMRAYGILNNARIISTSEAFNLLSKVRFGIELGMLTKIGYDTINRLMLIIQPGFIQLLKNKEMKKEERDLFRAGLIQELLPYKAG